MPYYLRTGPKQFWKLQRGLPDGVRPTAQRLIVRFMDGAVGTNPFIWAGPDGQWQYALPQGADARVFECAKGETPVETILDRDINFHTEESLATGWIATDGTFHPAKFGHHKDYIEKALRMDLMYASGWISVHDDFWVHIEKSSRRTGIITQAQLETLARIGRDPSNPHAPRDMTLQFEDVVPDWQQRKAAWHAANPRFEYVVKGARELPPVEIARLNKWLRRLEKLDASRRPESASRRRRDLVRIAAVEPQILQALAI